MKKILTAIALLATTECSAQQLYGDMESWHTYTVETNPDVNLQLPNSWYSTDSLIFYANAFFTTSNFREQVYRTPDAHNGSYAAELVTLKQDTLGVLPALLTNTKVGIDLSNFSPDDPTASIVFTGGTAITAHVGHVSAWVKYLPKGTDTASIHVQALHIAGAVTDTLGAGGTLIFSTDGSYMQVATTLTYTDTVTAPTTLRIFISSSGVAPVDSSILYVDDVNIDGSLAVQAVNKQAVRCYPNPAKGIIHISPATGWLELYSISGSRQMRQQVPANGLINISMLAPGSYFYTITGADGAAESKGVLQVE